MTLWTVIVEFVEPLLSDETDRNFKEVVIVYSWYYPKSCLKELRVITKSVAKIRSQYPQYPSPESHCYVKLLGDED